MRVKMMLKGLVLTGLILFFCHVAFSATIEDEIAELKARIAALEKKVAEQEEQLGEQVEISEGLAKIKEALEDISLGASVTYVFQATDNANGDNLSKPSEDVNDGSYSADFEFEKSFDDWGLAFIHLETGDGDGVNDNLAVFSDVNRDADNADNSVALTEAWYEQYFQFIPLTLTFGKLDPTAYIDTNEYANDECAQFLGSIFRNSPTIEFTDNAGGIRFGLAPVEFLEADFIVLDANADWDDFFDTVFFGTQINFKPSFFGRDGNYRFVGWLDDQEHTRWDDSTRTKKQKYGLGISCDQELTDYLGVFVRYGWQEPKVYLNGSDFSLEHSWSTGMQLSGSLWGRDEDVLGIAFGQIIPSGDYKEANDLKAKSEEHLEVYYSLKVNNHLTVSPDVQVIWDPYGGDATNGDNTIVVGGVRTQVDF